MRKTKSPFYYGWIIVAIGFAAMAVAYGVRSSFSVFYVAILEEFGWNRASTAAIFSINVVVYGISSPFAGYLVDRFGPRRILSMGVILLTLGTALCSQASALWHFYLFFGVTIAVGTSLVGFPANAAVLSNWFIRKRGVAFGIFGAGFGVSFLIVPLVQYFILAFGWRMAFVTLAVLVPVILLPLIILFSRHRPQDIGLLPDGINPGSQNEISSPQGKIDTFAARPRPATFQWTLGKAIKTTQFWVLFLIVFCIFGISENLMVTHQAAFFVGVGYSGIFAASVVGFFGIISAVGHLAGFLSDIIGRKKNFTLGSGVAILGILILFLVKSPSSPWMPYLYAGLFGLGLGIVGPTLTAAVADIFHGKHFGSINGFLILGFGVGGVIGPWVGGYIFDRTHSYNYAFLVTILALIVASSLIWVVSPGKRSNSGTDK